MMALPEHSGNTVSRACHSGIILIVADITSGTWKDITPEVSTFG